MNARGNFSKDRYGYDVYRPTPQQPQQPQPQPQQQQQQPQQQRQVDPQRKAQILQQANEFLGQLNKELYPHGIDVKRDLRDKLQTKIRQSPNGEATIAMTFNNNGVPQTQTFKMNDAWHAASWIADLMQPPDDGESQQQYR